MRKILTTMAVVLLLAGLAPAADPKPVKSEDFNGYGATGEWKPSAQDGWSGTRRGDSRLILDKKYGRDDTVGLAAVRKGENATNVLHWRARLSREVNTLRCYVMLPSTTTITGFDIITQQGSNYAGYVRVGHKVAIGIMEQPMKKPPVKIVSADKFEAGRWYKIELQHDFDASKQRARVDGGEWSAWVPMVKEGVTGTDSIQFYCGMTGDNAISFAIDDIATYHLEGSASE